MFNFVNEAWVSQKQCGSQNVSNNRKHIQYYLIKDQQGSSLVTGVPQPLQELLGGTVNAAFALHRLHKHCGDLARLYDLPGLLEVAVLRERHPGHDGLEWLPVLALAGERERAHGPAVEAVAEREELDGRAPAGVRRPLELAGELDGRLVGLGAAVGQEGAVREGRLHEPLGEIHLQEEGREGG
jgi:hypothetical protein